VTIYLTEQLEKERLIVAHESEVLVLEKPALFFWAMVNLTVGRAWTSKFTSW
jgi:hypothetical protein